MSERERSEPGIAVVDFGLGNLRSLEHKLTVAGLRVRVVTDPTDVATASHLVLPGVGHFGPAMERLSLTGLADAISQAVLGNSTPVFGICLGMQLLTEGSEESGTEGLGLIPGHTVRLGSIVPDDLPMPHIGWARVTWTDGLLPGNGSRSDIDCYFSHSYTVVCDEEQVLATAVYGSEFVSAAVHGSAAGVQFHPEKSHRSGIAQLAELIAAQKTSVAAR